MEKNLETSPNTFIYKIFNTAAAEIIYSLTYFDSQLKKKPPNKKPHKNKTKRSKYEFTSTNCDTTEKTLQ